MINLTQINIKQFIKLIKTREIDLEEFYKKLTSFIKAMDSELMAFQVFDESVVFDRVQQIIKRIKEGKTHGELYGVPIGVKDVFNTVELTTEKGSPYWKGYVAGNNARVVEKAIWEDGVVTGKTVTAELAVHHPGITLNPHNNDYSPGTSSMGSAVAVAAGLSIASLGTQTGSSIVRPASYTGIFGCKPSYGTMPRTGVLKTTNTLDHVGFFANNIDDIILLFDILRVRGENYPISNTMLKKRSIVGYNSIKIGILRPEYLWQGYQDYVKNQFEGLVDFLRTKEEIKVLDIKDDGFFDGSHRIHSTLYDKSLAYYFKRESADKNVISSTLYSMVEHGRKITVQEFHNSLKEQERMQKEFDYNYDSYDLILTPATANIAPLRNNYKEVDDTGLIWSLLGAPALNVPVFRGPDSMPFGLQVTGVKYSDYRILGIVKYLIEKEYLTLTPRIVNRNLGEKKLVIS